MKNDAETGDSNRDGRIWEVPPLLVPAFILACVAALGQGIFALAAPESSAPAPAPGPILPGLVELSGKVLFPHGSSELSPYGRAALEDIVGNIEKGKLIALSTVGYADRSGHHDRNQPLSERRAGTVNAYLLAHGVTLAPAVPLGMGDSSPVLETSVCQAEKADSVLKDCLALDRRVVVTYQLAVLGRQQEDGSKAQTLASPSLASPTAVGDKDGK